MFENRNTPLATRSKFLKRFLINLSIGLGFIALSLFVGMVGYRYYEQMDWLTAFYNASMILSGMGPVDEIKSQGGKIFAGTYAIYSGVALLTNASIIFAPILHRLYHKFHLSDTDVEQDDN